MSIGRDIIHLSVCSKIAGTLLVTSLLIGCTASPIYIPVSDRANCSARIDQHTVQRGETLYAIAARYNLAVLNLAEHNNIVAPYTIYPGQQLYINLGSVQPKMEPESTPIPLVKPKSELLRDFSSKNSIVSVGPHRDTEPKTTTTNVTDGSPKKTVVSTSHQSPTVVESASNKKQTVSISSSQSRTSGGIAWQWPAAGQLVSYFSTGDGFYGGIAIGGDIGESVVATAPGKVIYSGVGLAEYGKLIIIKHDSRYLSAYAHNRSLLVSEGESVKAGEQIAELGSTGTNEPKLHFEIRQNGKPVDPLLFLPNR